MKLYDFNTITDYKGATGVDVGYNNVLSGSIFRGDMVNVDNYDIEDWSPIFNLEKVNKFNMVLGYKSVLTTDISNSVAIGNLVNPTSSNTVQLGWTNQQVCLLDNIYIRDDNRDKSNISDLVDTAKHLEFITDLTTIKYNLSLREEQLDVIAPYPHPINNPTEPYEDDYLIEDDNGNASIDTISYQKAMTEFRYKNQAYNDYVIKVQDVHNNRKGLYPTITNPKIGPVRYGVNLNSLQSAITKLDSDFDPVLDHAKDVEGYAAQYLRNGFLEVPLINAIKELHKLVLKLREDVTILQGEMIIAQEDITKLQLEMVEVRDNLGLPIT
jgi:hypothetical protein